MRIKKIFSTITITIFTIVLFGCANTGEAKISDGKQKYIAVIAKGYEHEYWKTVEKGAKDAGEEQGVKITFEGPENETMLDKQTEMIKNAINNKADAIMLAALDTEALNPLIKEAEDKGIPVLTFDSDVSSDIKKSFIATNNKVAGSIAAREAAKLIGDEGEIAIVAHNKGAQTAEERKDGFKEEIEKNHPSIKIVSVEYSDGDHDKAAKQTNDLIEQYPNIKLIYGTNEGAAIGVCEGVKAKSKAGSIKVIGFDASEAQIKFLEEGVINGLIVQNPYNMGYLGVRNANKVLNGEKIEKRIDTGATYVNKDNLNDEDIQQLLYPMGKK